MLRQHNIVKVLSDLHRNCSHVSWCSATGVSASTANLRDASFCCGLYNDFGLNLPLRGSKDEHNYEEPQGVLL